MNDTKRRRAQAIAILVGVTLAVTFLPSRASAQSTESKPAETKSIDSKSNQEIVQTIFLSNATQMNDLNDAQTALRNVLPRARIYGLASQNAITLRATPEDMEIAKKLIAEIDRPHKVYRVTYTITESDSGKKTATQHLALIVGANAKATMKQGTRVPVVTGTIDASNSTPITQVQYLDVGLNIEASVDGVNLRTKVEQSTVAEEKSTVGIQDPVIRQTTLEDSSTFVPGKPFVLGSMDIPGTTRHQDIAVVAELIQ